MKIDSLNIDKIECPVNINVNTIPEKIKFLNEMAAEIDKLFKELSWGLPKE